MADLDLDDELLALTGDVMPTADAEGSPDGTPPSASATPAKETIEHMSPLSTTQKRNLNGSKTGSTRRRAGSISEGEASSPAASENSLGSGAMSESVSGEDPDADGDIDDEMPLSYPLEGKFRDEKDRREIMALPEFQREQILADRQEQALKEKQDAHLSLLLKRQQEADARRTDKKKRKASDIDEGPRKAARSQRTKQLEAVDAFKKQREQNLKAREQGTTGQRQSTKRGKSSDMSASGDSEVEWAEPVKKREDPHADVKDYQRVRVGRSNFAQVCFFPGFEQTIINCFTRACVGANPETGRNEYRLAQIKRLETGKPYWMEAPNKRGFWTDQYVRLAHGSQEKVWPFTACSDSDFTEQEFNRWRIAVENDGIRPPTKTTLSKTLDGIHKLLNHSWTDTDIATKLAKQNRLNHLGKPNTNNGTPASIEKKPMSQGEKLHLLNLANRKKNTEDVRKALIAEKRASQAVRNAAKQRAEKAKLQESLSVPNEGHDDLFGSDLSRAGTPGVGTPKRVGTPLAYKREKKVGGLPTFSKKIMDDEIIGALDMSIEIDI